MAYSKEQLRTIFQNKFDREAWKAIVIDIFGANKVRRENELFTEPDEPETGYYMGSIDTPDSYIIGLFYYKINTGSVAHKKVGLRNLVKRFINKNWGEFDAAIVVFDDSQDCACLLSATLKRKPPRQNALHSFLAKRIISIEQPSSASQFCKV